MINKIEKYESFIFSFVDKYEAVYLKVKYRFSFIIVKIIEVFEAIMFKTLTILGWFGKIARYTTWPMHYIWIKLHFSRLKKIEKLTDLPNFKMGAHYIYGKPSSGKSTFTYHSMMDYAYFTGKTAYTTAMMETPRKDVYGRDFYYHQLFSPSEFYQEGEQIVRFNTQRHNFIVYEEMLAQGMHQRKNKEKSYNDEVLPMISSMGTQRHQGIDLFYFISQLPRSDISIMHMLVGYHQPKIIKRFDYKHWLNTGKFRTYIKGWKVTSHSVAADGGHSYKLKNKFKWFYPNKYPKDFEYFNRLNLQHQYDNLPIHKGVEMK